VVPTLQRTGSGLDAEGKGPVTFALQHTPGGPGRPPGADHGAMSSPYVRLLRPFSFTASLVPLLLGAALAALDDGDDRWLLLPFVLVGGVGLHAVANVANDLYDFRRGVDVDYPLEGSSRVLTDGVLDERQVTRCLLVLVAVVVACGAVLLAVRGLPMLVLGLVGLAGAYGYTGGPRGYKYLGLGDVLVLVLMGPLMVGGSYLALTGALPSRVLLASAPVALLVSAVLVANNLRDVTHDRDTGVTTVSTALATRPALARAEYDVLLGLAALAVPVLVLTGVLPVAALLALLAVPLGVPLLRALHGSRFGCAEDLGFAFVGGTARLHAAAGALLVLGTAGSALA